MSLLSESFYHDYNSILTQTPPAGSLQPAEDPFADFTAALAAQRELEALKAAGNFYNALKTALLFRKLR